MASNSDILDMMRTVLGKIDTVTEDVKHLNYRVLMMEEKMKADAEIAKQAEQASTVSPEQLSQQVENIHRSVTSTMVFNNPLNMMFSGVKCQPGASLDETFRRFMKEMLHVEGDRAYGMPLHVQYLPSMSSEEKHTPPICVTLRSTKDREHLSHKCDVHEDVLRQNGVSVRASYYTKAGVRYWKIR